jgi:histidinol dehydrogenase
MPAGPSEVLVLADHATNPKLVAADMISQAEHGVDSIAGLITTSKKLATEVAFWLQEISSSTERKEIIQKSLQTYGFIIICNDTKEMISLANTFASEHLEIMIQNPMEIINKITSAGLILIGSNSPVALSDYGSGTNHVLPTGGFGHAYSGLSALDFVRRVNVIDCSRDELLKLNNHVKVLSEAENLPNHYKAVAARFEK